MEKHYYNDGQPRNYATGREYTGKNAATLSGMDDTFFMTFIQGRNLGLKLQNAKGQGIHLLLVEGRKTEKDGKEERYFYKKGFVVFGLSLWRTADGSPVPEPEEGDVYPWHKSAGKKESEVFKEPSTTPEPEPEKTPDISPEPEKTIPKTHRIVNAKKDLKRGYFLKNAAAFFKGENLVFVQIKDGRAVFTAGEKLLIVNECRAPDFFAAGGAKEIQAVIKGVDDFDNGIVKGKRVLWGGDPRDFPDVSSIIEADAKKAECNIDPAAIAKVIHAAADDAVKPSFHGACIEPDNIICSDARRLAVVEYKTGVSEQAIIPYCIAKNAVGVVRIAERRALSVCEYGYFSAPLVDGQFPAWEKVIPDISNASVLSCTHADWAELEKIGKAPSFKVIIREDGTYVDDYDAEKVKYERKVSDMKTEKAIGLNASYMRQAVLDGSTVYIVGPMSPVLIKTGDVADVIMPIQLKKED